MVIDVAVMDAAWPRELRGDVIRRLLAAMAKACGMQKPSATWWVNFRVIGEGDWGSRGGPLSIFDLLKTGAFSQARQTEIRAAIGAANA